MPVIDPEYRNKSFPCPEEARLRCHCSVGSQGTVLHLQPQYTTRNSYSNATFPTVLHGLKGAEVSARGARLLSCVLSSLVLTVIERSVLAQCIELVHDSEGTELDDTKDWSEWN